jgi:hypothetical protein
VGFHLCWFDGFAKRVGYSQGLGSVARLCVGGYFGETVTLRVGWLAESVDNPTQPPAAPPTTTAGNLRVAIDCDPIRASNKLHSFSAYA